MDILIIVSSFISFFLFIFLQMIVFRFIDEKNVFRWLVYIFFVICFISIGSIVIFMQLPLSHMLLSSLLTLFLYGLLSLMYVFAVFGITESSIRIRLLNEIYKRGERGFSESDILVGYNKDVIVQKRLERFVRSGNLTYDGKYYRIENLVAPFYILALFIRVVWHLYRGKTGYTSGRGQFLTSR